MADISRAAGFRRNARASRSDRRRGTRLLRAQRSAHLGSSTPISPWLGSLSRLRTNESPTKSRPLQRSGETDETGETKTCSSEGLLRLTATHETIAAKLPRWGRGFESHRPLQNQ